MTSPKDDFARGSEVSGAAGEAWTLAETLATHILSGIRSFPLGAKIGLTVVVSGLAWGIICFAFIRFLGDRAYLLSISLWLLGLTLWLLPGVMWVWW